MTETVEEATQPPAAPQPQPMPIVARRALQAPATINEADRTVEVVWSVGARAENWVPGLGRIIEELDMSPGAVRMDLLRGGRAPVLDCHNSWGARSVLGLVTAARIEGGRGIATLQFSRAADVDPVWQRVLEGTLRSVSVGYRVFRYEQLIDPVSNKITYRAVDWEPFEISVVPIPVDAAAGVRGEADGGRPLVAIEPPIPTTEQENIMAVTPNPATDAGNAPAVTPPSAPPPPMEANRAVPPSDPAAEAVQVERARIASLEPAITSARALLPDATVDSLRARAVTEGWTVERFRGALFDALSQGGGRPSQPANPTASTPSRADPSEVIDAMAEAIAVRAMPGYQAPTHNRHQEFLGWRPLDMIREIMVLRGEQQVPRDPIRIAERAFHTTSDFPLLLSAAANKMLIAAYQPAQPTYRQIFLRRDFRDFKPHRHLRVGDFPTLLPLMENGEIQAGTMSESQEIVLLQTFARRIRVTRPMLVNDDLGAFTDFAGAIGRRVADFENATAYGLMNLASGDGPTLTTGNAAVFGTAAARANKASAGTALDLGNLAAGRGAIMRQRTLDGIPINVGDQMRLLVGPNLELPARQLTVPVAANQIGQANVFASFVQPVVEPQIPNNRWYLFADPANAPVYVYGYLNGAEGPQVTTGPVQGVDGVEVQVIFDFGVGAIDYRGGWFNPGTV
ncbi:terminase [Roseococcus sp. SDR]|uniref:prohead protease/major capsid protein fusion protein n=1 Tax=Roseococcus sp. SDR TaxID=2835532 RepID=UPI001BCE54FF|nr:prohead protease/major capsid protein fusion protein [Roseococcus sp. SDR]MBS7790308.1 terminase [Roseococcus sp. SDR]MBV1845622.1 terminase [Roseococcus sp. SDR]